MSRRALPIVDPEGRVVADDLLTPDIPMLQLDDSVQRALELFALRHVDPDAAHPRSAVQPAFFTTCVCVVSWYRS